MAKTHKERLDELLAKEAEIKAQIQNLRAREAAEERKKDTRRKILIGGAVIAKIKRGEWPEKQLHDLLNSELTAERDRALFDGLAAKPSPGKPDGSNRQ